MLVFASRSFVLLGLVLCAVQSRAQSPEDKAAIEEIVQSQSAAWNHGVAEAFAAHYTEDGSSTKTGRWTAFHRVAVYPPPPEK